MSNNITPTSNRKRPSFQDFDRNLEDSDKKQQRIHKYKELLENRSEDSEVDSNKKKLKTKDQKKKEINEKNENPEKYVPEKKTNLIEKKNTKKSLSKTEQNTESETEIEFDKGRNLLGVHSNNEEKEEFNEISDSVQIEKNTESCMVDVESQSFDGKISNDASPLSKNVSNVDVPTEKTTGEYIENSASVENADPTVSSGLDYVETEKKIPFHEAYKKKLSDPSYNPYLQQAVINRCISLDRYYEQRGFWIAQYDKNTNHIYYFNSKTGFSQWEKPKEWDFNLHDDRSRYVEDNLEKIHASLIASKTQFARKQQASVDYRNTILEGAYELNIWYGRYKSDMYENKIRDPATTRCDPIRDAGMTKAQQHHIRDKLWHCYHFAKGSCQRGSDCTYLHALPNNTTLVDLAHDVFGRERHAVQRDDRGGVGALDTDCRTLYIGGLGSHKDTLKALWDAFGYYGEIEDLKIIDRRSIAFVTYINRPNAEFAKVAMSDQLLEDQEMLNVRWANDDPNPRAEAAKIEKYKDQWVEAAASRGYNLSHFGILNYDEYGNEIAPIFKNDEKLIELKNYKADKESNSAGAILPLGDYNTTDNNPEMSSKKKEESRVMQENFSRLSNTLAMVDSQHMEPVKDPWRRMNYGYQSTIEKDL